MFGRKKNDCHTEVLLSGLLSRITSLESLVGELRAENSDHRAMIDGNRKASAEVLREVHEFIDEHRGDEFTLPERQCREVIQDIHRVFDSVHLDTSGWLIRHKSTNRLYFSSDVEADSYGRVGLWTVGDTTFGPFEIEVDGEEE